MSRLKKVPKKYKIITIWVYQNFKNGNKEGHFNYYEGTKETTTRDVLKAVRKLNSGTCNVEKIATFQVPDIEYYNKSDFLTVFKKKML